MLFAPVLGLVIVCYSYVNERVMEQEEKLEPVLLYEGVITTPSQLEVSWHQHTNSERNLITFEMTAGDS